MGAKPEGTPGIYYLIKLYSNPLYKYSGSKRTNPVIIVLDTDAGTRDICNLLKIKVFSKPFHYKELNTYVVFISDKKGLEIELLFHKDVLSMKYNGKSFNRKKLDGDETAYSKFIFANKVIKPNLNQIDFSNFKPLLNNIRSVIADYRGKDLN